MKAFDRTLKCVLYLSVIIHEMKGDDVNFINVLAVCFGKHGFIITSLESCVKATHRYNSEICA